MPTNRKVALAGALISLALALLPVILDFDWRSTAGVIAGIIAVLGIVQKFLEGWSNWETADIKERTAVLRVAAADVEVPGLTEGVKGEGFEPEPEQHAR